MARSLVTRDNRLLQSQALSNAAWVNTNLTITDGTTDITAPDGTSTASKLAETVANGLHSITTTAAPVTVLQGQVLVAHFWIMGGGLLSTTRRILANTNGNGGNDFVIFNPRTGLVDFAAGNTQGQMRARGNWFECMFKLIGVIPGQELKLFALLLDNAADGTAGVSDSYAGSTTAGVYFAWPQLTFGSLTCGYPEYISTGAAAVIGNPRFA